MLQQGSYCKTALGHDIQRIDDKMVAAGKRSDCVLFVKDAADLREADVSKRLLVLQIFVRIDMLL
jgi:alanine racemase